MPICKAVFDPRDPTQRIDKPETWKETTNAALIVTDMLRAARPGRQINWAMTAVGANYCEKNGVTFDVP